MVKMRINRDDASIKLEGTFETVVAEVMFGLDIIANRMGEDEKRNIY